MRRAGILSIAFCFSLCGSVQAVQAPQDTITTVPLDVLPEAPRPNETPVVHPFLKAPFELKGAPQTELAIGTALQELCQKAPSTLGLPEAVAVRVDYVKLADPYSSIQSSYARLVQSPGADVEESQLVFTIRLSSTQTRVEGVNGRLFPAVKALPASPLSREQSETLVLARLNQKPGSISLEYTGTKIRWLQGAWRVTQEYFIPQQSYRAAVTDAGRTYLWGHRVYESPQNISKETP